MIQNTFSNSGIKFPPPQTSAGAFRSTRNQRLNQIGVPQNGFILAPSTALINDSQINDSLLLNVNATKSQFHKQAN